MIKFELKKKNKELYVKLFGKFLIAFKLLQKKVDKPKQTKENKDKLRQDIIMSVMDTIPKDKRKFH